ncbi:MAG: HlyD family efflux transporter periplasmic adaptor subunit [Bacteroidales bacterium]
MAGEPDADSLEFPVGLVQLGEWQPGYARLHKARQELIDFLRQDSYHLKIKAVKKQALDHRLLYDRQYQQRLIRSEELTIEEKQFNRMRDLYESGAISSSEFESAKSRFLKASYELESARTILAQSQIQIDLLQNQAIDLQEEYEEVRAQKVNAVAEALEMVAGMVQDWKLNYAFFSPVSGTVSLTRFWSENQFVKAGDRIMTILTGEPGPLTGRLLLPLRGAGKVQVGQKVLVRIDRYPYMEYGMLTGRVESVSEVADQEHYSVEVVFPDGLLTTYRKMLELSQGMTGSAEIITGELSLLVRIINPVRNLVYRNRA